MIDNVNSNLKIIREVIFNNASDIKEESAEPYEHDDKLQKLHDDAEAAFQEYGEAQRQLEALKTAGLSRRNNSALAAARAAVKATKAVYSIKAKKYTESVRAQSRDGLRGRGLRGAGVAPLDGVVRRGRTYNLNEIQGWLPRPRTCIGRWGASTFVCLTSMLRHWSLCSLVGGNAGQNVQSAIASNP